MYLKKTTLLSIFCLIVTLVQSQEIVIRDSDNFVKASLLVMTPGEASYSGLGHCALRMECPSEQLDYCFTLEMNTEFHDYIHFFTGNAEAKVLAIPTPDFLKPYISEKRGAKQYELNLNLEEKQELWKNLDEEMVKPPHLKFNFLNTNCVMMCMMMIESSLINEQINFNHLPHYMQEDNGQRIRYITRNNSWQQFFYILLAGAACDKYYDMEYTMSPETIVEILNKAEIQNKEGVSRSVLKGEQKQLLPETAKVEQLYISPTLLFGMILLIVIVFTILKWIFNWELPVKIIDIALLASQTIIGIILLYTSLIANLFGTRWNWYLIPFIPLPFIIWLLFHQKKDFYIVYAIYSLILILFICATPFSSQLDWIHQLAILPLLVRSLSLYFEKKKEKK